MLEAFRDKGKKKKKKKVKKHKKLTQKYTHSLVGPENVLFAKPLHFAN